jgi:hypothetical protein
MAFNPFKAFAESFKDDLALNLVTAGAFGLHEVAIEGVDSFLSSSTNKNVNSGNNSNLIDVDSEDETNRLREEQERLRRERQPGRRQTLLNLNSSTSNSLITGL